MYTSNFNNYIFKDRYKLEVKSLDLKDAGEYKVVIKNKCGEKSHQGVLSLSSIYLLLTKKKMLFNKKLI